MWDIKLWSRRIDIHRNGPNPENEGIKVKLFISHTL